MRTIRLALLAAAVLAATACSSLHRIDGDPPSVPPVTDLGPSPPVANPPYGDTVTLNPAPPPISGGTLAVVAKGTIAVAADADRDQIYLVDLQQNALLARLPLQAGDEPGRVAEDGAGRAHVVLRRGGAIVDVDVAGGKILERRAVCPSPRGLAYDAGRDLLWVACVDGELVGLPAAGGAPTRRFQLVGDLRDVLVQSDGLLVSRFRTAQVLSVDADSGQVLGAVFNPDFPDPTLGVAWRLIDGGSGGPLLLHQMAAKEVDLSSSGYGGSGSPCALPVVTTLLTPLLNQRGVGARPLRGAALPVDLAYHAGKGWTAVVAAGAIGLGRLPVLLYTDADLFPDSGGGCSVDTSAGVDPQGQPVAVAWLPDARLLIQLREPAALVVVDGTHPKSTVFLDDRSRRDTGHDVFHLAASSDVACASCHPEGGEDGRVWSFKGLGPRRTLSLRGGVLQRAPFHWDGGDATLGALLSDVFVGRMSGAPLADDQQQALARFLGSIPRLPAPSNDAAAMARGRALFEDPGLGCLACHAGPQHTSNRLEDIGGGPVKVPALVGLAQRAPYLHDGAAATLRDRFRLDTRLRHGNTGRLGSAQIDDLVAYLLSL